MIYLCKLASLVSSIEVFLNSSLNLSSVPPLRSLVVTELWMFFLSPHLYFSLQSLHSSSSFCSFSPCLITAQTSLSLAYSPHHCKQPFSKAVRASFVNTSPFWQVSLNSFFFPWDRVDVLNQGFQGKCETSIYLSDCPSPVPLPSPPSRLSTPTHLYSIRVAIPLRTAGCERVNSWLEFTLSPPPICSVEWEITFSMRIIEHGQGGASSLPTNHREQGHLSRRQ